MNFYLTGVNYKTASIDTREGLYKRRKDIFRFWQGCEELESTPLFTCNRIEIYIASENPDQAISRINQFKRKFEGFAGYGYAIYGRQDVFNHGLRLSLGLESQIKGEQQIFHQLEKWAAENKSKHYISALWTEIFDLREKPYASPVNIADVVIYDITKKLGFKAPLEIMVVGTGKVAQLFSELSVPQARVSFFAHKNFLKADTFAKRANGQAFFLKDLYKMLSQADVLISAASSPHYILKKDNLSKAVMHRKKPLYVYDLAMPRGVEPSVEDIGMIYLKNLDDMQQSINEIYEKNNYSRQPA